MQEGRRESRKEKCPAVKTKNKWSILWFSRTAISYMVAYTSTSTSTSISVRIVGEEGSHVNMALMPVYPIVSQC